MRALYLDIGVEELTKPELTGNWEFQLSEIEKGHSSRETFMACSYSS